MISTVYKNIAQGFSIIIDMIHLKKVSKTFFQENNTIDILRDTTISFEKNYSYAIMGASGSGKSTLLHMIAGIEPSSEGVISFDNIRMQDLPPQQKIVFLQKTIGLVFQQSLLIQELSVLENVLLKQIIQGRVTTEHQQHAQSLLHAVGLKDKTTCMPKTLSGGQQQRVSLLRSLFIPPQFLLADEPTGNVDKESSKQIMQLLFTYKQIYNMGLIISTHDMAIAQQCDYIITIEDKKTVLQST